MSELMVLLFQIIVKFRITVYPEVCHLASHSRFDCYCPDLNIQLYPADWDDETNHRLKPNCQDAPKSHLRG